MLSKDLKLQILAENINYIALDKPSGTHSVIVKDGGISIAEQLIKNNPECAHYSDKSEDGGLINRLDFETSGILIAAKSREAWVAGRKALLEKNVFKSYLALVEGKIDQNVQLDNYIGTPNRGAKKVKVYTSKPTKKERALSASSTIEILNYDPDKDVTLVRVVAHAARRHQVRVHLSFIKHPLVGDELYGSSRSLTDLLGGESPKFFLHAEVVEFTDSLSDELFSVRAEVGNCYVRELLSNSSML